MKSKSKRKKERIPKKLRPRYEEIMALIDEVCDAHLNEEYAQLARRLAAKLSRKRPSPLEGSTVRTWAGAILYTLGRVNFLFDKNQSPHLSADDLADAVGRSKSTLSNKARDIERMFNIGVMEPEWTLPSRMDSNPMAWFISVDGMIMDARHLPRHIQEAAYEKGLIPYIPGEPGGKEAS
jgi:hypothetical protein